MKSSFPCNSTNTDITRSVEGFYDDSAGPVDTRLQAERVHGGWRHIQAAHVLGELVVGTDGGPAEHDGDVQAAVGRPAVVVVVGAVVGRQHDQRHVLKWAPIPRLHGRKMNLIAI